MTTNAEELWVPPAPQKKPETSTTRLRKNFSLKSNVRLGLKGRTAWDWLPLLFQLVAAVIIAGTLFVGVNRLIAQQNQQQQHLLKQAITEQETLVQKVLDQQKTLAQQLLTQQKSWVTQETSLVDQGHEQILSDYLNSMSTLLTSADSPLKPKANSTGKTLAQVKTIAVFNALKSDAVRTGAVLQFLHDAGLITLPAGGKGPSAILLTGVTVGSVLLPGANLSNTDFDGVILSGANLSTSILTGSSFRGAVLTKINLSAADAENTDFTGANLENANLSGANMKGANISGADTKNAIVKGATW